MTELKKEIKFRSLPFVEVIALRTRNYNFHTNSFTHLNLLINVLFMLKFTRHKKITGILLFLDEALANIAKYLLDK